MCLFCFRLVRAPLSRMACAAAGLSGHLSHICKIIAPFSTAAWGLSCSPIHCPCSQSPSPSLWRVVPSTPLDLTRTVTPAVDLQSPYQTASTRFSVGQLPLSPPRPAFFLCPIVKVFSNSVVFSMQINYFKNCFCKYLCEYFSIVFDNIQHFHDLVIAFAGVFKIP